MLVLWSGSMDGGLSMRRAIIIGRGIPKLEKPSGRQLDPEFYAKVEAEINKSIVDVLTGIDPDRAGRIARRDVNDTFETVRRAGQGAQDAMANLGAAISGVGRLSGVIIGQIGGRLADPQRYEPPPVRAPIVYCENCAEVQGTERFVDGLCYRCRTSDDFVRPNRQARRRCGKCARQYHPFAESETICPGCAYHVHLATARWAPGADRPFHRWEPHVQVDEGGHLITVYRCASCGISTNQRAIGRYCNGPRTQEDANGDER
jgi:hypothetical protein